MKEHLILYLKQHPSIVDFVWTIARYILRVWGWFVPVQQKTMIFCSFGGRNFNDSPKALYDEICRRKEFDDWRLIWAFNDLDKFDIPKGEKVKVDTVAFFHALLFSKVWISNSGMDRGIGLHRNCNIIVETWHGTPLKRICGEEVQTGMCKPPSEYKGAIDNETIRCAQSEYDREIFTRIFHATKGSIILSDLPRNDELLKYTTIKLSNIRKSLGISKGKKVIFYTPTYREYLINSSNDTYIAPPMDLKKWEQKLGDKYVLLIRAHYAVSAALNLKENDFVKDVSKYPSINDLYAISDMMISDYSSTYFDYSILDRPMFCFAYDKEEYEAKRGLYLKLEDALPCAINKDEDSLIDNILNVDIKKASKASKAFHQKYAPYAGNATNMIIDAILKKMDKIIKTV